MVAEAFILNKEDFKYVDEEDRLKYVDNLDKLEINHKDEEPKNNKVDNLEWCTSYYNKLYGTRNEKISKANVTNKSKRIYQYDLQGNLIKEWSSLAEIERQLGYSNGNICQCCNGKRKTAYGYIWRYEKL